MQPPQHPFEKRIRFPHLNLKCIVQTCQLLRRRQLEHVRWLWKPPGPFTLGQNNLHERRLHNPPILLPIKQDIFNGFLMHSLYQGLVVKWRSMCWFPASQLKRQETKSDLSAEVSTKLPYGDLLHVAMGK